MSLREHLGEVRKRVVRSAIAVVLGVIAGWFLSEHLSTVLLEPIVQIQHARGPISTSINFADPLSPFNFRIQLAFVAGLVLASPVWLYQFWAFVMPGLTRKERLYSYAFVAAAVPLFLAGGGLAWLVIPKALVFLNEFVPEGGSQFVTADMYVSFVLRIVLAFGFAFVVPVVLVALNLAHVLPGRTMARQWRLMVFGSFLFAAVATPTPEVMSMVLLASAMCLLFSTAIGVCLLLDRRRSRRSPEPDYEAIADEDASAL